jgi:tRNA A37 threonylcarbamoyladenosine dehydratase
VLVSENNFQKVIDVGDKLAYKMKLVRHKVRDFYKTRIDEIYATGTANAATPTNIQALREAKVL